MNIRIYEFRLVGLFHIMLTMDISQIPQRYIQTVIYLIQKSVDIYYHITCNWWYNAPVKVSPRLPQAGDYRGVGLRNWRKVWQTSPPPPPPPRDLLKGKSPAHAVENSWNTLGLLGRTLNFSKKNFSKTQYSICSNKENQTILCIYKNFTK
jgi:hypothetical protein